MHSLCIAAVIFAAWDATAKLVKFSFFLLHSFTTGRFILTVGLSNLSIRFFLPLLSQKLLPFHLKEALYSSSWACSNCQNHYCCALGPFSSVQLSSAQLSSAQFSSVHFSSVQLSRSVVSDSLRSHESQHARLHCSLPTPGVCSDSCPLSQWCHPAISSSVLPFSSCPQSLPASGSFPMSQHFTWGGQIIGVSASASVLPMNTQTDLLQDGLVGSPCSPRDSQESSPTPQFKTINSSVLSFLHSPTLTSIHDHWKNHSLD